MNKINPRFLAAAVLVSVLASSGLIWMAVFDSEAGDQLGPRLQGHWPLLPGGFGRESALGAVTVRVDPSPSGRPISPLIYGVAAANSAEMRALGATLGRWG